MRPSSLFETQEQLVLSLLRGPADLEDNFRGCSFPGDNGGVEWPRENGGGTASGLLMGIGVGVAIGIFLAPKSGKDTRDQLVNVVEDGLDGAIAKGQKLTRRAQQTLDEARERVKDAAEAGEQAYRDAKSIAS